MNTLTPELSHIIDLGQLPNSGRAIKVSADDQTLTKIARRLGVVAVKSLNGEIAIRATPTEIHVEGFLNAQLTRTCVISLDEMDEIVSEKFCTTLQRSSAHRANDDEDEKDGIHEGADFDAGEFLVQQLALAMAPYPKKPGAKNLAEDYGATAESSPFAELGSIRGENNEN